MKRSAGVVACLQSRSRGPCFLASIFLIGTVLACTTFTVATSEGMKLVQNRSPKNLGGLQSQSGLILCLTNALGV